MSFSAKITAIKEEVMEEAKPLFARIEAVSEANTLKILDAMRKLRVSDAHFTTTTGYAYGDMGREKLDELFAEVFRAEESYCKQEDACEQQSYCKKNG